jgi:AP-3 complex subunit sigma
VYRSYATLHFVFVVDLSESELGMLDLIQVRTNDASLIEPRRQPVFSTNGFQVFVEALDRAFENVCELDLVFHFDEVRISPLGLRPRDFSR